MSEHDTFWTSVRNHSGWGWALGEIKRNPIVLDSSGPRWKETPLHWAMLSHMEATALICAQRPQLLFSLDDQARAPMDWAMEKIYFLREQQEGEVPSERARTGKMVESAKACALFGLNWIASQGLAGQWSGDSNRFQQLALTAGELDIAKHAELARLEKTPMEVWLCGLAGMWDSATMVEQYVATLKESYDVKVEETVAGRPLGLHVAYLWAEGKISAKRAIWFHQAGVRLDQETASESIEVFCAKDGEAGAVRLEKLVRQLDW